MSEKKKIKLDEIYNDRLLNDNYNHFYSIYLEKNKHYFIELITKNDYEFNLKIYNNEEEDDICNYDDDLLHENSVIFNNYDYDIDDYETKEDSIEKQIKDHNDYIYKKYPEDNFDDDMQIVLYDDENKKDSIEIVIKVAKTDDLIQKDAENYMNAIKNQKRIIDYNNKIYFSALKNDLYTISVSSEYENEEGDYSLIIREVEDINRGLEKQLLLNKEKSLKFKKKNISEKFSIDLRGSSKYTLKCKMEGLKIFIFGEGNTITNEDGLDIIIDTKNGGLYLIELISLYDNHENEILLEKTGINSKNDIDFDESYDFDDYYSEEIFLKDKVTSDKYSLCIENGKLLMKKVSL